MCYVLSCKQIYCFFSKFDYLADRYETHTPYPSPFLRRCTTHQILQANPTGRVMIGADCTVGSAPLANIQAAVSAAHGSI